MQAKDVNYREIPLSGSDRVAIVDARDYCTLAKFNWRKRIEDGKPLAYRYSNGKIVYMHRQVMSYRTSDYFTDISHNNGDTLDNRFSNLRPRYSTASHDTRFHTSLGVQRKIKRTLEKYHHLSLVNVVDSDGVVLRSNVTSLITQSADELNHLLAQRLKAAQLVAESRNELLALKTQINQLLPLKEQITNAIASLDATLASLQPK